MLKIYKKILLLCCIIFIKTFFVFGEEGSVEVLISQVGIESTNSVYDEFIELYNPNDYEINLTGWSIKRITKNGSDGGYISSDLGVNKHVEDYSTLELKIPPHGYFLIIPRENCGDNKKEKCFLYNIKPDNYYSTNSYLANDNGLVLYDSNKNVVDSFCWGNVLDRTQDVSNPNENQSIFRKIIDNTISYSFDSCFLQNSGVDYGLLIEEVDKTTEESVDSENEEEGVEDEQSFISENESSINEENTSSGSGDSVEDDYVSEDDNVEQNYVIITEILINPEDSDRDNEFIELYNFGENDVDLGGWIIKDLVGSTKEYVISEDLKIKSKEFLLFYSDETGITLNNAGDGVLLKNKEGELIDETDISSDVKEGVSFCLDSDNSWVFSTKITPGSKNVIEFYEDIVSENEELNDTLKVDEIEKNTSGDIVEFDFSDGIFISEIMPDPDGRDNENNNYEWIEIYNSNDFSVDLIGWILDDFLEKGSNAYQIKNSLFLEPKSYFVFSSKDIKISLNNSGDEINLLWPDGILVDSVSYSKSKEKFSYSKSNYDNWYWSSKPTPGETNIINSESEEFFSEENILSEHSYLDDIKNSLDFIEIENYEDSGIVLADNKINYKNTDIESLDDIDYYDFVNFYAIVSTPTKIFGKNVFYVFDNDSKKGIEIYSYKDFIKDFELGDKLNIRGYISQSGGEKRIVVEEEDIEVVDKNNLFFPSEISIENVDKNVGCFVEIKGVVEKIENKSTFYLKDQESVVKVYLKPESGVIIDFNQGDYLKIVGQISSTSLGLRILPRFQSDIDFLDREFDVIMENNSTDTFNNIIFKIFIFLNIIIILDWIRIRFKNKK